LDWLYPLATIKIAVSVFWQHVEWMFLFGASSNSGLPESGVFHWTGSSGFLICIPSPELLFFRSTKDYVLVYAQSTLAEQSTPAYIAIIDSDMPVTNIIWVGEDWLLGVGWTAKPDVCHMCVRDFLETPEGFHRS